MCPWTNALWFNIQAEGQGSPRQAFMYRQYPFSEQKQQKATVKVKETDPTCSRIWLFPVTQLLNSSITARKQPWTIHKQKGMTVTFYLQKQMVSWIWPLFQSLSPPASPPRPSQNIISQCFLPLLCIWTCHTLVPLLGYQPLSNLLFMNTCYLLS